MFTNLFNTKKTAIIKNANRIYSALWNDSATIEIERESRYNNYCRLSGNVNGINYQVHINSDYIANLANRYNATRTTDARALQIFATACACADRGEYFAKYAHIAAALVLN